MTRQILITAAVVGALASPLTASDQSVEKAARHRVAVEATEATPAAPAPSHDAEAVEVDAKAKIEELKPCERNKSAEQIEELGCCYYWNDNAEQVEELGPYYWNQSAEQIEDLGCCYIWAH